MESILDRTHLQKAFSPHTAQDILPNEFVGEEVEITHTQDEGELQALLADVRTMGDPEFRIYACSAIQVVSLPLDAIQPMTYYLLQQGIEQQRGFHHALASKYGLDIFRLRGRLEYDQGDEHHAIAPPIVERYIEEDGNLTYGLIDGTHRVWTAISLGYTTINVVLIDNVPLPPYAMPVGWDEVTIMTDVPPIDKKKKYRDLKRVVFPSGVTQDPSVHPKYYLYRDYSHLGSSGAR